MNETKSRRARWALPGLGIALGLLLTACGGEPRDADLEQDAAVPVTVETAQLTSVPREVVASGGVEPWRRVEPGTKVLGRIDEVGVREGDAVQRGQLLARLESRDLQAAVTQARAAIAMAEAQLAQAEAQHDRMVRLHERGSVTDKNLEDATAAFEVARAGVEQAQANLAAAQVNLGYARIESPLAGWVTAKMVDAGDMATPGRPLFALEDLSRVKVTVEVPESEIGELAEGATATVDIAAIGASVDATVDRIVPAGDPASRTFQVRLVLDNPDGAIKSGMFARARFPVGSREVLAVPQGALVQRGQLEGLFAVEDGRARLRWIKTGARVGNRVVVLSGLAEGDHYVISIPAGLTDGSRVEAR